MFVQHDIGSAQQVSSLQYLIFGHHTRNRIDTPSKKNNTALFDNLDLRKYYVKIDGLRYPRDGVLINYEENEYIKQYRDLKIFFTEYVGEELLNPFISYPDKKMKNLIGIIDLGHQRKPKTPKNFNNFKNTMLIQTMLDCF